MIYLVVNTAEYSLNIKKLFSLKKDISYKNMEIFSNENIILINKKTFFYNNIISLSEFFAKKEIKKNDIFIDLDYKKSDKNEIFIINKISYDDRDYIVDILYKHNFNEGAIRINGKKSEDIIVQHTKEEIRWEDKQILYTSDGAFEVANHFFDTHQIVLGRILFNDEQQLMKMIENFIDLIIEIDELYKEFILKEIKLTEKDLKVAKEFSEKLRFSITMEIEFMNLMKYYKILNKSLEKLFEEIKEIIDNEKSINRNNIDKKRGKVLFEYIKKIVME